MKQAIKPVERAPGLGDQVYETLRAQLRQGAIDVGVPLQEVPLAAQLGVSRTPVREAMARLASEGLLSVDRRSYTVPALTRRDIDDIYELRFLLEPAALRGIAPITTTRARRADVEAALGRARAAHRAGDSEAFREANVAFRSAWLALVPNRRLVRAIELYADHMQHIRAITLGDATVRTIVLRGLTRITAALAAGDGDAAAAAAHEHLTQARRAFLSATGLADGGAHTPPDGGGARTPPDGGGARTPPDGGGARTPPDGGGARTPRDGGDDPRGDGAARRRARKTTR